jgi:intein/homing endonuclease
MLNSHIYFAFRTKDYMKSYSHEMGGVCDGSEFVGRGNNRFRINLTTGRTIKCSPEHKPPSKPTNTFKTLRKSG